MEANAQKSLPQEHAAQPQRDDTELRALETLELVTKQMAAAVTRCSRDLRYVWVNQAYADWIQRPLDEIVGHPIVEVLGKEAFEHLRNYFECALSGKKVTYDEEIDFQGIGRRCVSATYTPTFDGGATANGWVAVVIDVTERKRAEEARFRHAAIVESSKDGIISMDLGGIITSWNAGAERMGPLGGSSLAEPRRIAWGDSHFRRGEQLEGCDKVQVFRPHSSFALKGAEVLSRSLPQSTMKRHLSELTGDY